MTDEKPLEAAGLAIVNVVRAEHGLGPCKWTDLPAESQDKYKIQANAALLAYGNEFLGGELVAEKTVDLA